MKMNYKKILIASIFLIAILTIGAVSAANDDLDSNISINADNEDAVDSSINEMELKSLDNTNLDDNNLYDTYLDESSDELKTSSEIKIESESNDENLAIENLNEENLAVENSNEENLATDNLNEENLAVENSNNDVLQSEPSSSMNITYPKTVVFDGEEGDYFGLSIFVPKDSKGNIKLYVDNKLYATIELSNKTKYTTTRAMYHDNFLNDEFSCAISINQTGIHNLTVKYNNGTDTIEKSGLVNITYKLYCWDEFEYGESDLRIILPLDASGKVTVKINGKTYSTFTRTEQADHDFTAYYAKIKPILGIGKYTIYITYHGDKKYLAQTTKQTINVVGKIKLPWSFSNNEKITIKLPKKANGKLVVKVYDANNKLVKKFTKKLVKGKAYISFSKKNFYGKYSKVVAYYTGKDYDVKKQVIENVIIPPRISMPKKMIKGEKKYVSINLPNKKGVLKVYVYIKTKSGSYKLKVYSKKLVKGKAKISLAKLKAGDHIEDVKFTETLKNGTKDTYYYSRYLKILKPLNIIPTNVKYGSAKVKIKAYKAGGKALAGKYITIKINKKTVKKVKTNKKGIAVFKIPKTYKPKTYKITAIYKKNRTSQKIRIFKA